MAGVDLKGIALYVRLPGKSEYNMPQAQLRVKEIHPTKEWRPCRKYLYLRFRDGSKVRYIYIAKLEDAK